MSNENFNEEELVKKLFAAFLFSCIEDDEEEKKSETETETDTEKKKEELDNEFADSILDVFEFLSEYDWDFDNESGNVSVVVTNEKNPLKPSYHGIVEQRKSEDGKTYYTVTLYMTASESLGAIVIVHPDTKNISDICQINTDSCLKAMYVLAKLINDLIEASKNDE